jgi:hypothetical protein
MSKHRRDGEQSIVKSSDVFRCPTLVKLDGGECDFETLCEIHDQGKTSLGTSAAVCFPDRDIWR